MVMMNHFPKVAKFLDLTGNKTAKLQQATKDVKKKLYKINKTNTHVKKVGHTSKHLFGIY